jgi:hypothetical protein
MAEQRAFNPWVQGSTPWRPTHSDLLVRGHVGHTTAYLVALFKLIEAAQERWRAVSAPHRVVLVRAGARFEKGRWHDGHTGGDYVLTGPESLSQAAQVSIIGDALGRRIKFEELSPDEFRSETEGSWPRPAVDMLLAAWGATIGRPAFITSTVSGILGSAPRSFRQWAADHATAFMGGPAPSS